MQAGAISAEYLNSHWRIASHKKPDAGMCHDSFASQMPCADSSTVYDGRGSRVSRCYSPVLLLPPDYSHFQAPPRRTITDTSILSCAQLLRQAFDETMKDPEFLDEGGAIHQISLVKVDNPPSDVWSKRTPPLIFQDRW
jgi:hypothetical protein